MTNMKKKAAPSKVTAVNLVPEMRKLSNSEKVLKIQEWIGTVYPNTLVQNGLKAMMKLAEAGQGYQPISFAYSAYDEGDLSGNSMYVDFDLPDEEQLDANELKTSIRMPHALHNAVLVASEKLATRPSDIIKMALSEMYLDSGEKLGAADEFELRNSFESMTTLKPKLRKNSTLAIRQNKEDAQRFLDRDRDTMSDDAIERSEARIASMKA